jgi:hypothetical protein
MKYSSTFFFFSIYLSCLGQGSKEIKTELPCTDEMAQKAKGKWIQIGDNGSYNTNETKSRIDQMHDLISKFYPEPTGVDVVWHRTAGKSYFGSKRKYYTTNDGSQTFDYSNLPHFTYYYYNALFFPYQCAYGKTHSIIPTYPGETGTGLNIIANFTLGQPPSQDDTWTIDGLPVATYRPPITIKEGIEFTYPDQGINNRHVLIHRKGMLPYKTVTRKVYLEYCITYYTKLWDETIANYERMPVRSLDIQEKEKNAKLAKFEKDFANDSKKLKANVDYYLSGYQTEQQRRDEQVIKAKKIKSDVLKNFTDEIEKSSNEGLLNTPAMVTTKYQYSPSVFETDPAKGLLLITENPDYIRKDLPKHVPQFFIVAFKWSDWLPLNKFAEDFFLNFRFERLQAMIDK